MGISLEWDLVVHRIPCHWIWVQPSLEEIVAAEIAVESVVVVDDFGLLPSLQMVLHRQRTHDIAAMLRTKGELREES